FSPVMSERKPCSTITPGRAGSPGRWRTAMRSPSGRARNCSGELSASGTGGPPAVADRWIATARPAPQRRHGAPTVTDFRAAIAALGDPAMEGAGPALRPGVPTVLQVLPSLVTGGVERGASDMARAIEAAGLNAVVMSAGGPMADALVADGLRHLKAPVASKNPAVMLRNAGRIACAAAATGAAVIHARSRAPAWSALIAARRAN